MEIKKNKKIGIIIGTRPEIIKMSPIIRECKKRGLNYFIIHSNQHYSEKLDTIFFKELNLPKPKYNLSIGSGKHGEITGKMLIKIEDILVKESPSIILVQGDTNTVLAGGLAAAKLRIPVGHIEAGLRSYDPNMPEETNRILTDHLSSFLFCPTSLTQKNLIKEGLLKSKVHVTGNTVVDALIQNIKIAEQKSTILNALKLKPSQYILATAHRQENVDNKNKLKNIIEGLEKISKKLNSPVILPAHPRLIKMLNEFKIKVGNGILMIEPVGYLDFLILEKNALIIATDSGGVQEEACILKTPCITLRENTERPETISVRSNVLVGTNAELILKSASKMLRVKNDWKNPFGNGHSAEKIIKIITK